MIEKQLELILKEAKASLANNPRKELILPVRKKIWRAMGVAEYDPSGTKAKITNGLLRRTELAVLCVKNVMKIWDNEFPDDDEPHIILSMLNDYLKGRIDRDTCWRFQNNFMGDLENLECREFDSEYEKNKNDVALNVGFASVKAILTGLNDENIGIYEEEDLLDEECDPWTWDASFYSCAAYSQGFPWNNDSAESKRYEFWRWYLDEAVPQAYEAYSD